MTHFTRRILSNGLRVLVHEDHSTPLVAVNISYYVGSRDEHPEKTGFGHLFEHLMFGGSKNIPDFDDPLQRAESYYEINLPDETLRYFFRLIAVKYIFEHPPQYGYYLDKDNYPPLDNYKIVKRWVIVIVEVKPVLLGVFKNVLHRNKATRRRVTGSDAS